MVYKSSLQKAVKTVKEKNHLGFQDLPVPQKQGERQGENDTPQNSSCEPFPLLGLLLPVHQELGKRESFVRHGALEITQSRWPGEGAKLTRVLLAW